MVAIAEVTAIVPAYNEAETIESILAVLVSSPRIDSIIMVDDGSIDNTFEIAKSVKMALSNTGTGSIEIIRQPNNFGKTMAVRVGFERVKTPFVLLLDADLQGLNSKHIEDLLNPVCSGLCDMTIGLFKGGRFLTDLAHITNPNLSGQRAMRRQCLEAVEWPMIQRFGLESFLTDLISIYGWTTRRIKLVGLTHRTKPEKRGFFPGWREYLKMWWQVVLQDRGRQTGWSSFLRKLNRR